MLLILLDLGILVKSYFILYNYHISWGFFYNFLFNSHSLVSTSFLTTQIHLSYSTVTLAISLIYLCTIL